jgi:hypothetical protein
MESSSYSSSHLKSSGQKMLNFSADREYGCNCGASKSLKTKLCRSTENWINKLFPQEKISNISFAEANHLGNLTLAELCEFYRSYENLGERGLDDSTLNKECLKQIDRDITRTFPHSSYFYSGDQKV